MTRRAERRQSERARAYKLCSLALQYPDEEIVAGRSELAAAAATLSGGPVAAALGLLLCLVRAEPRHSNSRSSTSRRSTSTNAPGCM